MNKICYGLNKFRKFYWKILKAFENFWKFLRKFYYIFGKILTKIWIFFYYRFSLQAETWAPTYPLQIFRPIPGGKTESRGEFPPWSLCRKITGWAQWGFFLCTFQSKFWFIWGPMALSRFNFLIFKLYSWVMAILRDMYWDMY